MIEELPLELLRRDGGTQPRASINTAAVEDYAEVLTEGGVLPPIIVFYDGETYWLADGYHRWKAAQEVGFKTYPCEIHQGTVADAQWFSYGANKSHGLRRTNHDKQCAVEAAINHPVGSSMSDQDLADHVGVSDRTVWSYRNKHLPQIAEDKKERTVTRKGKAYTQKTANIGSKTPKKRRNTLEEQRQAKLAEMKEQDRADKAAENAEKAAQQPEAEPSEEVTGEPAESWEVQAARTLAGDTAEYSDIEAKVSAWAKIIKELTRI